MIEYNVRELNHRYAGAAIYHNELKAWVYIEAFGEDGEVFYRKVEFDGKSKPNPRYIYGRANSEPCSNAKQLNTMFTFRSIPSGYKWSKNFSNALLVSKLPIRRYTALSSEHNTSFVSPFVLEMEKSIPLVGVLSSKGTLATAMGMENDLTIPRFDISLELILNESSVFSVPFTSKLALSESFTDYDAWLWYLRVPIGGLSLSNKTIYADALFKQEVLDALNRQNISGWRVV